MIKDIQTAVAFSSQEYNNQTHTSIKN